MPEYRDSILKFIADHQRARLRVEQQGQSDDAGDKQHEGAHQAPAGAQARLLHGIVAGGGRFGGGSGERQSHAGRAGAGPQLAAPARPRSGTWRAASRGNPDFITPPTV